MGTETSQIFLTSFLWLFFTHKPHLNKIMPL